MLAKVNSTVSRYHMLSENDTVVVAVSGGPDSTCMLHLLKRLEDEYNLRLIVAHLDHKIRRRSSQEDARFVESLARKLDLETMSEARDVLAYGRENFLSLQDAARRVRYDFLLSVAEKVSANRIAVGQNADDQAETTLMWLLRGAGRKGLSGIPATREVSMSDGRQCTIIRPLIRSWRREILDYLRENNLTFRQDPSNLKPLYTRNRIRLHLLPLLEERYSRNIKERLVDAGTILREEEEYLSEKARDAAETLIVEKGKTRIVFDRPGYRQHPRALRRRILRAYFERLKGDQRRLSYSTIEAADWLITTDATGKSLNFPAGVTLHLVYDRTVLAANAPAAQVPDGHYPVAVPGQTEVPEMNLVVSTRILQAQDDPMKHRGESQANRQFFDFNTISVPLHVRYRRPGDRFLPLGMSGSKKLKDFFIDNKVPTADRDRTPLLVSSKEDIVWVMGMRIDHRWRIRENSTDLLEVQYRIGANSADEIG